jgi:hypothetical protein
MSTTGGVEIVFGKCMYDWGKVPNGAQRLNLEGKGRGEGARDGSCRRKLAVEDA